MFCLNNITNLGEKKLKLKPKPSAMPSYQQCFGGYRVTSPRPPHRQSNQGLSPISASDWLSIVSKLKRHGFNFVSLINNRQLQEYVQYRKHL